MKELYLISGLGADKRVFDFIDLSGFKINHVEWIPPLKNESLESYSQRLLTQIPLKRPTLMGVSFGGIVCIEIGKIIEAEKIIIVSSAKTKFDIPVWFRMIGYFRLHKLFSAKFFKSVNPLTFWFFGMKSKQEKELLTDILKETDGKFLKWAIDRIVNWRNTNQLRNLIHIHGSSDRIIPAKSPDIKIADGGHLMIVNRANELSRLIREILAPGV